MSLSQRILDIWGSSSFTPPNIQLIFNENEYMAVIEDSEDFLRFMSSDGQIFIALSKNCQHAKSNPTIGDNVYVCTKVDPILCSPIHGPHNEKDIFVLNNIAPLLI